MCSVTSEPSQSSSRRVSSFNPIEDKLFGGLLTDVEGQKAWKAEVW